MSRRLTRAEYDNTVRDLVGLDLQAVRRLPGRRVRRRGVRHRRRRPVHLRHPRREVPRRRRPHPRRRPEGPGRPQEAARRRAGGRTCRPGTPAKRVVRGFAERAYRRPVEDAEVERLLTVFDRPPARGDAFEAAVRLPLKAVLISPYFLFLVEPEADQEGVFPLAHYPLAARLSYFLWASMPDDELFALARQGKLQDDEVLRRQVRRMLKDPKARGLAETFAPQWLGLRPLGDDRPAGPEEVPRVRRRPRRRDAAGGAAPGRARRPRGPQPAGADRRRLHVRQRPAGEALRPARGDRPRDAEGGAAGPDPRRRAVHRGGADGRPRTRCGPARSSAASGCWRRCSGRRSRRRRRTCRSCRRTTPPATGLSLRKQLEPHRKNPDCAELPRPDGPARVRAGELRPARPVADRRSAASRWTPPASCRPGETFSGPAELKDVLLKRKDEFLRALGRKLLGYALGRQLYPFDQCVIDDAREGAGGERLPVVGAGRADRAELPVPAPVREEVSSPAGISPGSPGVSSWRRRFPISRRTFLRGAGVALGLPLSRRHAAGPGRRRGEAAGPHRVPVLPQRRLAEGLDPREGRGRLRPAVLAGPARRSCGPRCWSCPGLDKKQSVGGDGHYAKTANFLTGLKVTKTTGKDLSVGGVSVDQTSRPRSAGTRRCRRWNWASTRSSPASTGRRLHAAVRVVHLLAGRPHAGGQGDQPAARLRAAVRGEGRPPRPTTTAACST